MQKAGDYSTAAVIFHALGDYQDSASRLEICNDYIAAIEAFNATMTGLAEKNAALNAAIEGAEAVAYSEAKALDETLRPALKPGT